MIYFRVFDLPIWNIFKIATVTKYIPQKIYVRTIQIFQNVHVFNDIINVVITDSSESEGQSTLKFPVFAIDRSVADDPNELLGLYYFY